MHTNTRTTRTAIACIGTGMSLCFSSLALAGSLVPPAPTGPATQVSPYYLVAMVEVTCKVPVFSEIWHPDRVQPSTTVTPPTSCEVNSLASWVRSHLQGCSYVVTVHDDVLHLRPGVVKRKDCVAASSSLDVAGANAEPSRGNGVIAEHLNLSTMLLADQRPRGPDTVTKIVKASGSTTFRDGMISAIHQSQALMPPTTLDVVRFGSPEAPETLRGRSGVVTERYVGGPYLGAGRLADGPYSYRTQWWKAPGEIRFRPYSPEETAAVMRLGEQLEKGEITASEAAVREGVLWQATIIGGDQEKIDGYYEMAFGAENFKANGDRKNYEEEEAAPTASPSHP